MEKLKMQNLGNTSHNWKILKDLLYVLHCYYFGGLIPPASLTG
jgi:hypothetical protein